MTRDYARLVKSSDSTKTLRFLFDVGEMEEQTDSFHYDSITDYVVKEFLPNAQNSVSQNLAKKYEIAARVCKENKVDCKFPTYEETPFEKDVLVFPCEAGRFAYLLTTVKGNLENAWYDFQYKVEAGAFGSSTENGVVPMQPSIYEGYGTNYVKLFPIEYAKIPNGTNSPFNNDLWTALFVDWRYFAWSDLYYKQQIPTDLATRRTYTYMRDAYSVAKNLTDIGVFPNVPTFSLSTLESLALSIPQGTTIKNLDGAPLPIAVDLILACYGYRLYGGKTPLLAANEYLPITVNITTDNITSDAVSVLQNAYLNLSRRPTETRIYFRNDRYGVFSDASTGTSNTYNKLKHASWKTLQNWSFHVEKAVDAEPFQSDLLYVTNIHDVYSWGSWLYETNRTRRVGGSVYNGDIVGCDNSSSFNLNERNVYALNNPVETINGIKFYTKAVLRYAPVKTGSVFLDVSGSLEQGGCFVAENEYEKFGTRQATVEYAPKINGVLFGFWRYINCNGDRYKCDVSNLKDYKSIKEGDVILVSCNEETRLVFAIGIVDKNEYTTSKYEACFWFDNSVSCKHRKYETEYVASEKEDDVEITFDEENTETQSE